MLCLQEDLTAVGLLPLRLEQLLQVLDLTPEEQVLLQEDADLRLYGLVLLGLHHLLKLCHHS